MKSDRYVAVAGLSPAESREWASSSGSARLRLDIERYVGYRMRDVQLCRQWSCLRTLVVLCADVGNFVAAERIDQLVLSLSGIQNLCKSNTSPHGTR